MNELPDQEARTAIREDLDTTLLVEAAAGAGKTTELVRRVLGLVRTGRARISSIVAVTFTEKAAGEMKLRLRTAIERAREASVHPEERVRLERAARELEVAHIGTIHGFCADLLRERPVEAGIDPLFVVADDAEARRLYREAFEPWFQTVLDRPPSENPGVHRVLRRRSRDDGPKDALFEAGFRLIDQRDFDGPWTRPTFDREKTLDDVVRALDELGALADLADDKRTDPNDAAWLYLSLDTIRRFGDELRRKEATRVPSGDRDYDGLEAELRALGKQRLWNWKGWGKLYQKSSGLTRDEVIARRASTKAALDRALALTDADLAACLREELRPLIEAYGVLKARSGKLDFLDLLLKTRALLAESREARRSLRARYTHLLVDEFQDTDPLQAEIVFSLGRSPDDESTGNKGLSGRHGTVPGKLFFVGDPKQSIYRFRRADVAFYEAVKRDLLSDGARLVHLTVSFRSTRGIQSLVNAAFEGVMKSNDEGSQAAYVPLAPYRREEASDQPQVVALPVPRPYSTKTGKVTSYAVEDSLPDAVGAYVDWLVRESGYTVAVGNGRARVPVGPEHVCLLFKRFSAFGSDVTRPYVRALEARRIAHVLVGGRGFHEREEVLALRNAAQALEFPADDFSIYATLKGPLFSLTDSAIFSYRTVAKSLDLRKKLDPPLLDEHTLPVAEALAILKELHVGRNRRPYADTLGELLERTRAHAGFAIWPTGEQALANVLRVLDVARKATHSPGVHSFRAFVEKLEEDASRGNVSEAYVVEEDSKGVRMMTVHRAKGLEFPVVILVDPTARPTHSEPSRYVDAERKLFCAPVCGAAPLELSEKRELVLRQDHEEALRLLYVATTRARDMLVVPVVGDGPLEESWLGPLSPALYPLPSRREAPEPFAGNARFGTDTVLERPEKAWNARPVRPGIHRPEAGSHAVLFFDPHALALGKDDEAGLRQQKILSPDSEGKGDESQARYDRWAAARTHTLTEGGRPSVAVITPSEAKERGLVVEEVPVTVERTKTPREGRPHGKRYGILVHALLAEAPLDPSGSDALLGPLAKAHGRSLGASPDEIAFAENAAREALTHDVMVRAGASVDARREVAVTFESEDHTLVEGVVDLAFEEPDGSITVVDFKTDVDETPRLASYRAQVSLYARAITKATGKPTRGVLLLV